MGVRLQLKHKDNDLRVLILQEIVNTNIVTRERSHMTSAAEGGGGYKMLTVADKGGGGLSLADVSKNT